LKRRKFLIALSALPFLGFLKPDTDPVKVPGLDSVVVKVAGETGSEGPRIQYGETEPVLNVWISDSPPVTEIMWAWKEGDTKHLAYMSVVPPGYAKRCNNGEILSDSLEFHRYE